MPPSGGTGGGPTVTHGIHEADFSPRAVIPISHPANQLAGKLGFMKTTVELPDDLIRAIKLRAVRENRKLKDLVAELLRRGLDADAEPVRKGARVQLPLVHTSPAISPDREMTPERVAELLLQEEVDKALRP